MTISIRGENKLKLSVTPTECFGDVLPPKKPFYFSKSITFLGTQSFMLLAQKSSAEWTTTIMFGTI